MSTTAESESVAQVWRHLSVDDRRTLQRQTGRRSIAAHVGRTLATLRQLPTHQAPPADVVPPTTTQLSRQRRHARARPRRCSNAAAQLDRALALVPPFASGHALEPTGRTHSLLPATQRATTTSCPCTRPSPTRCPTATRCGRRTRLVDLASARAATRRLPTDETKRPVVTPRRTVARPRSATADGHSVPRQCSCWHHAAHAPLAVFRRANDEPKERRSTASPWHVKHSSRRRRRASSSGTHTCTASAQQRSSASLGLALSPASVQRARHVDLFWCQRPCKRGVKEV
jgi:hypothetical protein